MGQRCAYQYRFYPTRAQQQILARTFGCVRYVYNWALRLRIDTYKAEKRGLSTTALSKRLTILKQQPETAFLAEVSCVPLQQSLRHLADAFTNFFEGRAGYPKFKARHDKQSAEYTKSAFTWDGHVLRLAKMEDPLAIRWSRSLPEGVTPTTVIVSKDTAGRYFVSIRVEQDMAQLPPCNKVVGLDLGLKSMVVTSDGEAIGNPKFFARDEKKLARAQRRHAKKKKGSRNREKARRKVARIHAHIADRRRNYQHQLSTRIIRENQTICVESLAVKNMVKNHCLAKSIHDVGWGEFVRQLEYKAAWYGRTLVKIDTFFPSSKRCFACGHVLETLPLEVREWTCPTCGVHHDRDLNAARNVLAERLSDLNGRNPNRASLDEAGRLSREGGNPLASSHGEDVKQDIEPDLVVVDYYLPDMTGIELYDHWHTSKHLQDVPAIMVSAALPARDLQERGLPGLAKPLDLDELLETTTSLLRSTASY